jgi:hypothetical protein
MNTIDLKESVSVIKECEELKIKIDSLVSFAKEVSDAPINSIYEFSVKLPKAEKKESEDTYGESPLSGLWNIKLTGIFAEPDNKANNYFTEQLSVQDSFIVVNSLIMLNREKLKQKIQKLKSLGINI